MSGESSLERAFCMVLVLYMDSVYRYNYIMVAVTWRTGIQSFLVASSEMGSSGAH